MSFETFKMIVDILVVLLMFLVSTYIMPYVKTKLTNEDLLRLEEFIELCVRSAEQLFTPEQWANKKNYVMAQARDFIGSFVSEDITDEMLDALVEGIVNRVKKG